MTEQIQYILARQKEAAVGAGNLRAAKALRDLQLQVARLVARGFFVSDAASEVTPPIQRASVFTRKTFHDYLGEELNTCGQEIVLPEPLQAIVEVHNILAGNGFDVAPVVYVDRKKGEAIFGVLETVVRPDFTDGIQMYYSNPDADPLAKILERGRTGLQYRIDVPDWVRHVPVKSRFALSWDEIDTFVAPEVVNIIPYLKEQVTKSGIVLRVPTKTEFQSFGERYHHFGDANSWEWLYDKARFGSRLVGGDRAYGGLGAVLDWPSDFHDDGIGFRLLASSLPQKLP